MLRYFSTVLLMLLLFGCTVEPGLPSHKKVQGLSLELQDMEGSIEKKEADMLAREIYNKTQSLSKEYELVSPPQYHNFLVNIGLRQKGLCYHFSDALYFHLKAHEYKNFDFHLVGANIGEYWREHNALVVVPKGCESEICIKKHGIVIDAWRDSGNLFYAKLNEDKAYKWTHRSERCKMGLSKTVTINK